jgi:hypothetical protein
MAKDKVDGTQRIRFQDSMNLTNLANGLQQVQEGTNLTNLAGVVTGDVNRSLNLTNLANQINTTIQNNTASGTPTVIDPVKK